MPKALAAKMPGDLKVCYFVNSGSEANDLALLMARAYTGNYDMIALRNAYHGGNASGMGLTAHHTWKFNVPHSFGVHHAITPDPYRGQWNRQDAGCGKELRGRRQEPDRLRHAGSESPASSPNQSKASAVAWSFLTATSSTPTNMCARPAAYVSRMKSRPASAAPARITGASKRRVSFPTSSAWRKESATAVRSARS